MEHTGVKHYLDCIAFSSLGEVPQLYVSVREDITARKTLENFFHHFKAFFFVERESLERIFMTTQRFVYCLYGNVDKQMHDFCLKRFQTEDESGSFHASDVTGLSFFCYAKLPSDLMLREKTTRP